MTWLFVRFYVGVLIVLFLAWWIHGAVLKRRADAETERVIVAAHRGGTRLVATELNPASPEERQAVLHRLREQFDYPVDVVPVSDLPPALQQQIASSAEVAYYRFKDGHCVVAALAGGADAVRLGPFPNYDLREIEEAIGGWMRLAADKLHACRRDERANLLEQFRQQFAFPVDLADRDELPDWPRERIRGGADVAFYPIGDDRWCAATPLPDTGQVLRFGPNTLLTCQPEAGRIRTVTAIRFVLNDEPNDLSLEFPAVSCPSKQHQHQHQITPTRTTHVVSQESLVDAAARSMSHSPDVRRAADRRHDLDALRRRDALGDRSACCVELLSGTVGRSGHTAECAVWGVYGSGSRFPPAVVLPDQRLLHDDAVSQAGHAVVAAAEGRAHPAAMSAGARHRDPPDAAGFAVGDAICRQSSHHRRAVAGRCHPRRKPADDQHVSGQARGDQSSRSETGHHTAGLGGSDR